MCQQLHGKPSRTPSLHPDSLMERSSFAQWRPWDDGLFLCRKEGWAQGSSVRNSPGKNTGVSCHFLLQGIFLTQESNPGLLHRRQILYQLNYKGKPIAKIRIGLLQTSEVRYSSKPRIYLQHYNLLEVSEYPGGKNLNHRKTGDSDTERDWIWGVQEVHVKWS